VGDAQVDRFAQHPQGLVTVPGRPEDARPGQLHGPELATSVGRPESGLEDIGEFAGRTYDYYTAHPELIRLLLWEHLSGGPVADEANRTEHYKSKAQAYAAAQDAGILDRDLDPAHLVFLIIALNAWWFSAPQLALMLTGADDHDPAEHARRRASVVKAAQRLALPPSR
jgi:Tetracyclin repressor-like, C-terminal domain